jgi:hypothetical protein
VKYLREVSFRHKSSTSVQEQLHFADFSIHFLHKLPSATVMKKAHLNDKVHQLVLQHRLRMKIGDQKRNIIPLNHINFQTYRPRLTGIGFLLRMIKLSARPVKNLVNLWARIRSISSACLILMLMRIELMDGSIRTCSFSLRAICSGFRMISGDVLKSA